VAIVKNPIIKSLQTLIGLSPGPPEPLVIDIGNASLTAPIFPDITRRSEAGIEAGWFIGILENEHSGADAELSFLNPYLPGASAVAPYPPAVPDGFDVWCLGISGIRSAATGDLTGAIMDMNPGPNSQGWGQNDLGAAVVDSTSIRLAFFDGLETTTDVITNDPMITPGGLLFVPTRMRVPRGGTLGFNSRSAAAATFQAIFLLGLFPAGLGQDVVT